MFKCVKICLNPLHTPPNWLPPKNKGQNYDHENWSIEGNDQYWLLISNKRNHHFLTLAGKHHHHETIGPGLIKP